MGHNKDRCPTYPAEKKEKQRQTADMRGENAGMKRQIEDEK